MSHGIAEISGSTPLGLNSQGSGESNMLQAKESLTGSSKVVLPHEGQLADAPVYRRGMLISALLVLLTMFPLIFLGGLVTSHGAGMSVPDWPNSYGYNMFLFPVSEWLGGIFFEHTHRLLGTLVGFFCINLVMQAWGPSQQQKFRRLWLIATVGFAILAILSVLAIWVFRASGRYTDEFAKTWSHTYVGLVSLSLVSGLALIARRREPRRWLRWACIALLVAVCFQGLMGGLRVNLVNLTLAIMHGCFAQVSFCFAAFLALASSRRWIHTPDASSRPMGEQGRFSLRFGSIVLLIVFLQLIVGAIMRHYGAGLAIPDLPLAYGKLLPPANQPEMDAANQIRQTQFDLAPTILFAVWVHFAHRLGAILVSIVVISWGIYNLRKLRSERAIAGLSGILLGLLGTQLTLGVFVLLKKKPADVTSLHVATGALTLMASAVLVCMLARRFARMLRSESTQPVASNRSSLVTA